MSTQANGERGKTGGAGAWVGGERDGQVSTGFSSCEAIPCAIIIAGTCPLSDKAHRTHNTKNEPYCELQALGNNNAPTGFIDCNK